MAAAVNSVAELIINTPLDKLDIKLILRHVLNLSAAQLIIQHARTLTAGELEQFELLCSKLINKVPINYLLGYREFYSHQFKVTDATLIPRPETELLVDTLLTLVAPNMRILDLGVGCGCIAISAKLEYPSLMVEGVDKYIATLNVAKVNALCLGAQLKLYQSDWFSNVCGNIIVSNPPYIAANDIHLLDLSYEPQAALTDFNDGLDCLREIIQQSPQYLAENGWLMVEHGFDQAIQVQKLYRDNGFTEIKTIKDYANLDRVTLGRLKG
jgi:release factor glutamine methyltransferase